MVVLEFLSEEGLLETLDEYWHDILPMMLEYNYTVHHHHKKDISQRIREEYLTDSKLSRHTFHDLTQVGTFFI